MPSRNKKLSDHPPASPTRLSAAVLFRPCKSSDLGFRSTDELPDLQDVIGQPRAIRALKLGSEVTGPGFNVFILGLPGSGRSTLSREFLERKASSEPVPPDWCYVNNFEDPHRPKALCLPPGRASVLRTDIQALLSRCKRDISRAFESEEYTRERDRMIAELKKNQEVEFLRLQHYVEKFNFVIVRASFGFMLVPAVEGKPLKPEDIEALSPDQRHKLAELQTRLSEEVEKSVSHLRDLEKLTNEQIEEFNTRTVLFQIGPPVEALKEKYAGLESVISHFDSLQKDIIKNASLFRASEGGTPTDIQAVMSERDLTHRYDVNVLVDSTRLTGAPVLFENYPSYTNLLGRIEHEAFMGISRTDFTMIRPGALHLSNGGYLLLPARDVLGNPFAWEGLKRALRDGEVRMVELANQLGYLSTATLEPEPIPLNIKVVLVGTPLLYYLLRTYDEDFTKLFKVRAEFAQLMERTPETEKEYGLYVKSVVDDNHLLPFDRSAVARIIEHSSRLADDQEKLSTRFGRIADLVREAAYWAAKDNKKIVRRRDVQRAIDEGIYRSNLIEERIQELIDEGTLRIDLLGEIVGQVNALSVYLMGDYEFGRPARVTAIAFPGKTGVVDIERQAKLGGALHTKGVLILNSFINYRYGREQPLSLSASLTFEQSYEEVQGDSASAAECYALLSAISAVALRQDRAITGSVDQFGQIQPVGGLNEKIEGFFDVCKVRGLTGEQGVIIPKSNRRHLMLRNDVIQAVRQNKFHVWGIQTIDEGIPLLTNLQAGQRQMDGSYPDGTLNQLVSARLAEFTKSLQAVTKNAAKTTEGETKEGEAKNTETNN